MTQIAANLAPEELSPILRRGDAERLAERAGIGEDQAEPIIEHLWEGDHAFRLETVELADEPLIELKDGQAHAQFFLGVMYAKGQGEAEPDADAATDNGRLALCRPQTTPPAGWDRGAHGDSHQFQANTVPHRPQICLGRQSELLSLHKPGSKSGECRMRGNVKRKFQQLAVATVISVVLSTGAIADEGFYVGIGGGLAFVNDTNIKGHTTQQYSSPLDATAEFENGVAISSAVGYSFANGWRVEGELGYRKNDLGDATVRTPGSLVVLLPSGAPAAALTGRQAFEGDISAVTLMANLYYDFDLDGGWKPYVGGGFGLARLSAKAKSEATGATLLDDKDTVFTYKIGIGVGYEIGGSGERPVIVSLDYRYFETENATFTGSLTGTDLDAEQHGHYVGVSLRFGL